MLTSQNGLQAPEQRAIYTKQCQLCWWHVIYGCSITGMTCDITRSYHEVCTGFAVANLKVLLVLNTSIPAIYWSRLSQLLCHSTLVVSGCIVGSCDIHLLPPGTFGSQNPGLVTYSYKNHLSFIFKRHTNGVINMTKFGISLLSED